MEHNKNAQKVAYSLFSFIIVALMGVVVYQQLLFKRISRIDETGSLIHAESEKNIDTSAGQHRDAGNMKSSSGVAMGEFNELEYQLNAAEEELAMTQEQLSVEIDQKGDLKELQKMMSQTPEAKKQLRMSIRNNLDKFFGPMFAKLGLSEEQNEEFKNLIVDYQMAQQANSEKMRTENVVEKNPNGVAQSTQKIYDEYQNKMVEMFGEEAKNQYFEYEEREGELHFASEFSEYLSGTDKLTDEQQESLVDSMSNARKEYIKSMFDEGIAQGNTSGEEREKRIKNINTGLMEAYLDSADTVLSSSQLERFEYYINKRIQQINAF